MPNSKTLGVAYEDPQLDGAIVGKSGGTVGFYGTTPVAKPAALTAALTAITHTAPGTPDYAIQNLVQNTGFGFVTADEGNTVLSVIVRLNTRVSELETKLQALGLLA
jgi:hypothetical protein